MSGSPLTLSFSFLKDESGTIEKIRKKLKEICLTIREIGLE